MTHLSTRATRRASALIATVGAVAAVAAAPASARMYVSTSVTTDAAGHASGYVEGYAYANYGPSNDDFRLSLMRAGTVLATTTEPMYVSFSQVVHPQDLVTLTDVTTGETHTATVTGRPLLDASVCGSPSAFTGVRDAGATASVSADVYYGPYDTRNDYAGPVDVYGPGTLLSGRFSRALAPNWDITASEGLAVDGLFTVFSDVTRPVGTCAAPTVAAPPPARPGPTFAPTLSTPRVDVVPPLVSFMAPAALFKPFNAYKALMAGTFSDALVVGEPSTVTQTLYLDDGAQLPKATAAAARRTRKAKRLTAVGGGHVTTPRSGTVTVKVRLSVAGRRRLRRAKTTKLALVTVVKDRAGNVRVLAPKRFTVKRPKGTR